MTGSSSYWACVLTRNGGAHLASTLDSLLNQAIPPAQIVVVDDGSTDRTGVILSEYARTRRPLVKALVLPDHGYDVRRVPRNVNLACRFALSQGLDTEYFVISGDDCFYPRKYASSLLARMESRSLVVVSSGRPRSGGNASQEHSPSGSGRMIRSSFWKEVGSSYPVQAGWETWLLCKAQEKGLEATLYNDLIYEHARPRGSKHQFAYWGAAMYTLGYDPFYALGRIAKNLVEGRVSAEGCMNLLRGYVKGLIGSSDPFISPFEASLRRFVRAQQRRRIANIARLVLRHL